MRSTSRVSRDAADSAAASSAENNPIGPVLLDTDIQVDAKFEFDLVQVARKVCEQILRQEGCPYRAEISLVVTGGEEVHQLNREFRGIDRTTDVLSFPGVDFETPADFSLVEENEAAYMDPETECLMLGDIVINAEKVKEQAAEYGHSQLREFAFLVAHSMLHLCGYDHIDPADAEVMEPRQEFAMRELGIGREYES